MVGKNETVSWEMFYEAVGRGITGWAMVEGALCDVFSRILICAIGGGMRAATHDNLWVVGNVFNSITNIPARLQMIDDMVGRLVTDEELLKEWSALKSKVEANYKRRNRLAHQPIWGDDEGASFIRAPMWSSRKETYDYDQVVAWASSFKRLENRTTDFAVAINKWLVENRPLAARTLPF